MKRRMVWLIAAALSATTAACVTTNGPSTIGDDLTTDQDGDALATSNSLTSNSLTSNSLTSNSLTASALVGSELAEYTLTSDPVLSKALNDPAAQQVLKYIVSCALPEGVTMKVAVGKQVLTYSGQLGLAPEWGEDGGKCDQQCQGWVSACVLARINYLGVPVQISLRGRHDALTPTADELSTFPVREATYYGNIFTSPQLRYTCLPPEQTAIPRVCGPDLASCVVHLTGECTDVCTRQDEDKTFSSCRDATRGGVDNRVYPSITVFTKG